MSVSFDDVLIENTPPIDNITDKIPRFLEVDFIDNEKNIIVDNKNILKPVISDLRQLITINKRGISSSLERKKIDIFHIGDSHIQADLITSRTRRLLQNRLGSAGRGLITPLKLISTNEPSDYRITSTTRSWHSAKCTDRDPKFDMGIGAMAIKPKSSKGEVDFNLETFSKDNMFSEVTIFHHHDAPRLIEEALLSTDMKCVQDSIKETTHISLAIKSNSISLTTTLPDSLFKTPIYYGFYLENGENGIIYNNVGINGASFINYGKNSEIADQISILNPKLIIISMGTNEAAPTKFYEDQFYQQIDQCISNIRAEMPNCAIVLTTPVGNFKKYRGKTIKNINIAKVRDVIVDYAINNDLAYWDLFTILGGEESADNMLRYNLFSSDMIHFKEEGYRLQGELLYKALMKLIDNKETQTAM